MKQRDGFAYIALLILLAILMLIVMSASETIAQKSQREREKQLFFVGNQYRNAIASYYENTPQGAKQFPKTFDSLLEDNRSIKTVRHLRQVYQDPITNDYLWGLVKNEQQQILGVYSLSSEQVLMTNLDLKLISVNITRQNTVIYSDLKFIYKPETTQ